LAGEEQNRFSYLSGFRLIPDAAPLPLVTTSRGTRVSVCAGHTGYVRAPVRLRHVRRISHARSSPWWRILDILKPPGNGTAKPVSIVYSLPLAPTITVEQISPHGWTLRVQDGRIMTGTFAARGVAGEWKAEPGWLSRSYGERAPTVVLRFRGQVLPRVRQAALLLSIAAGDQ
jgi:hypothetical protein